MGRTCKASTLCSSPAPALFLTPDLPLLNQKLIPGKSVRLALRMLCKTTESLPSLITALPFSGAHARAFSTLGTHILQKASFPQISSQTTSMAPGKGHPQKLFPRPSSQLHCADSGIPSSSSLFSFSPEKKSFLHCKSLFKSLNVNPKRGKVNTGDTNTHDMGASEKYSVCAHSLASADGCWGTLSGSGAPQY